MSTKLSQRPILCADLICINRHVTSCNQGGRDFKHRRFCGQLRRPRWDWGYQFFAFFPKSRLKVGVQLIHVLKRGCDDCDVLDSHVYFSILFYNSNRALSRCLHSLSLNTRGLGEFSQVMQTLDYVSGLNNCLEFSQPSSCLDKAM